jgi:hypothetical protein
VVKKKTEDGIITGKVTASELVGTVVSGNYTAGKKGEEKSTKKTIRAKITETLVQWGLNASIAAGLVMMIPYIAALGLIVGAVLLLVNALKKKETAEEKERKRLEE